MRTVFDAPEPKSAESDHHYRRWAPVAAVGAAALLAACGSNHKAAVKTHKSPIPIYQNGDSINLLGLPAKIENNSIVITQEAINNFRTQNQSGSSPNLLRHNELDVAVLTTGRGQSSEMIITDQSGGGPNVKANKNGDSVLECSQTAGPDCIVVIMRGATKINGGEVLPLTLKNSEHKEVLLQPSKPTI